MAKTADVLVTVHLHLSLPDDIEIGAGMLEVTKQAESVLQRAGQLQSLNTKGILVQVGKVLGAGVPT